MCEPTTIMMGTALALNVAGQVANYAGQSQRHDANVAAAQQAEKFSLGQIGLRETQIQQGGAQTIMQADRQARQAQALASVSAGESGVSGISVDMLLGNLERQRAEYDTSVRRNTQANIDQLEAQKLAVRNQEFARENEIPAPNPFAFGLTLGGQALGSATDIYRGLKRPPSSYGYPTDGGS